MDSVKKKFLYSYFLIYIIIALFVSIAVCGIILYNTHMGKVKLYTEYSVKASQTIDEKLSTVENFMSQISQTKWVNTLLFMQGGKLDYSRVSYQDLLEYEDELVNFVISNGFMDDMAIIFNDKDLVLSTFGRNSVGDFKKFTFLFEDSTWGNITQNAKGIQLMPFVNVNSYGLQRQGLLYYAGLPINIFSNSGNLLLIFVDSSRLADICQDSYSGGVKYIVADENGKVVINNLDYGQGADFDGGGIRDYILYSHTSPKTGWKYYTAVPSANIILSYLSTLLVTLLILLLLFLAGTFLVLKFALKSYSPFHNFINDLKESLHIDEISTDDEFRMIGNEILRLRDKQGALTAEMNKQKPVLRNTYLSYLLSGNESVGKFAGLEKILDISFPFGFFCCVSTGHKKLNIPQRDNVKIYFADMIEGTALLINYEEDLEEYLKLLAEDNQKVCFGVGEGVPEERDIKNSYRNSLRAYSYQSIIQGSLIYYSKIRFRDEYAFEESDQNRLSYYIRSGNEKEMCVLIVQLSEKNKAVCNHEALKTFYVAIQFVAIKVLREIEDNPLFTPNIQYADLESVTQFCKNVCRFFAKHFESHEEFRKFEILKYVDEHYKEYGISLSVVGEHFGFSASYISKFFKENYNTNFLDYINKKRIALSKSLLSGSNMDILMIAKSVGYDNDVTFRRLFKKYEGISPSEYRG